MARYNFSYLCCSSQNFENRSRFGSVISQKYQSTLFIEHYVHCGWDSLLLMTTIWRHNYVWVNSHNHSSLTIACERSFYEPNLSQFRIDPWVVPYLRTWHVVNFRWVPTGWCTGNKKRNQQSPTAHLPSICSWDWAELHVANTTEEEWLRRNYSSLPSRRFLVSIVHIINSHDKASSLFWICTVIVSLLLLA